MESGLKNKIVLITGASGGIGRALADLFAAEGCRLGLHGNSQIDSLKSYVQKQTWAERAEILQADVTRPGEMEAACAKLVQRWGRLDCCVANAGIWPVEDRPLHEIDEARLRHTIDVNLMGAIWTARAFLQTLARTGPRPDGQGASIVFTGSTAGRFGERDHSDYSIAKAGLYGMMRSVKNEIVRIDRYGRVNIVEPGWTATHMARPALQIDEVVCKVNQTIPMRQLGRAVDIARAIAFLSSPLLARHISGEIITVSGGMEGRLLWQDDQIDVESVRRRLDEEI